MRFNAYAPPIDLVPRCDLVHILKQLGVLSRRASCSRWCWSTWRARGATMRCSGDVSTANLGEHAADLIRHVHGARLVVYESRGVLDAHTDDNREHSAQLTAQMVQ